MIWRDALVVRTVFGARSKNRVQRSRRAIGADGVMRLVQPFHRKSFLLLPIDLGVLGGAELSTGELAIQRQLAIAIQTAGLGGP